jgi:hypothetical protein
MIGNVMCAPAGVGLNQDEKDWLTQEPISQIWGGNFFTLLNFEQKIQMEDGYTWLSFMKALLNTHVLE